MDILISLLIGFALGIVFFIWDNKKGKKWHRRWYDLSHKTPLAEDSEDSFIVNQPFSKKLIPAVIITILFSYVTWSFGDINPILAIISSLIMLVAVLIGFYVGPFMSRTVPKGLNEANKTLKKAGCVGARYTSRPT